MSEAVRHFPLTQEQQSALKELRESALKELRESASLEAQLTPVATNSPNAYAEQSKKREKLVGQNTLRFVIQHLVHNETGLKHWFDFNQYMALDQLLISKRLGAR